MHPYDNLEARNMVSDVIAALPPANILVSRPPVFFRGVTTKTSEK